MISAPLDPRCPKLTDEQLADEASDDSGYVPTNWLLDFESDAATAAMNATYRAASIRKLWQRDPSDPSKVRLYALSAGEEP